MSEEKVGASVAPNLTGGAPVRGTAGGEQIVPQRAITSTGTSLIKKQNITFKGQTIKMGQKNLQSILPNTHGSKNHSSLWTIPGIYPWVNPDYLNLH